MHCYIILIPGPGGTCVKNDGGGYRIEYPNADGVMAILFKSKDAAEAALDCLDHGTAKKCRIIPLIEGAEAA